MELKYKNWDEISLQTFRELKSIESDNELSVLINRLSILCDSDSEDIRSLTIPEFNKLTEGLSFLNEEISNEIKLKIEIDGKAYGLIPDLNFISAGEFIDIENFKQDSEANIHLICAVLYRPIVKEDELGYLIAQHSPRGFQQRAELFLNKLPITTVWGTLLFFSSLGIQSLQIIEDYLKKESVQKETKMTQQLMKKKRQRTSQRNGHGMTLSQDKQKTTRSK
jgi:hypothetical protein